MGTEAKKYIKFFIIVVVLGFIGGTVKVLYEDKFGKFPIWVYLVFIAVVFGAYIILGILPTMRLKKHILKANSILYDDHDAERYLKETIKLQNRKKSFLDMQYNVNKAIIDINVAVGYIHTGRTEKAIKLLSKLDVSRLHSFAKATYYTNYLYALFKQKKKHDATMILENHKKLLIQYEDNPNIGCYINLIFAYNAKLNKDGDVNDYIERSEKLAIGYYERIEYEKARKVLIAQ
ncbi:MAG: hypothetical protein RSA49_01165 [Anaerovoracaceae bacterium]